LGGVAPEFLPAVASRVEGAGSRRPDSSSVRRECPDFGNLEEQRLAT